MRKHFLPFAGQSPDVGAWPALISWRRRARWTSLELRNPVKDLAGYGSGHRTLSVRSLVIRISLSAGVPGEQ
jgi:hypothetical protein